MTPREPAVERGRRSRTGRPAGRDGSIHVAAQVIRFLATGVLNTIVGLAIIYLCWRVFGFHEIVANGIGYGVGLCVSFFVNRRWTFRSTASARSAVPRFLAVFAVAYVANLATFILMHDVLLIRMEWATVVANVPYTIVFFVGSRLFVFAERRDAFVPIAVHDAGAKAR